MPLDSNLKTPLIMSKWFWPCVISISLFKAHLRSKTNQLFLIIAAWIYFGDGKHSKEILTGLIKRRGKKKISPEGKVTSAACDISVKKKISLFFCDSIKPEFKLALQTWRDERSRCLPSRHNVVIRCFERNFFTWITEPSKKQKTYTNIC